MEEEKRRTQKATGRFLRPGTSGRSIGRSMMILVLLTWDGLLLYMIVECLIAPAYGAAFVALVSVYLGYQF